MTIRNYKFGNSATDNPADGVEVGFQITAGKYQTCEQPYETDYQVPVGKTFYITELVVCPTGSAGARIQVGYGDTGVALGVTAPANAVILTAPISTGGVVSAYTLIPCAIAIPAGKYPYVKADGSGPSEGKLIGIVV